jgi:hypothetical protein
MRKESKGDKKLVTKADLKRMQEEDAKADKAMINKAMKKKGKK